MAHGFFRCICNQAIDSTRIHLLYYAYGGKHMATHDVIQDYLPPLLRMLGYMFCVIKHMFFQRHFFNHHDDELILCLQQMVLALWET